MVRLGASASMLFTLPRLRPRIGRALGRMPGAYAVGSAGVARRRRRLPTDTRRIGWVVYGLLDHVVPGFWALDPVIAMRVGRVARELNAPGTRLTNELYRPDERYDVVVFAKVMDERHRREAERARERGAIVVYDAHVNYYEVWGDYEIEGTAPTEAQQRDAVEMTRLADHVLTSSSYLLEQVRRFNPNASWIPDGVDPTLYRGTRRHEPGPLRLVWSGVAKKARQLDAVVDVLARLPHAELVVVSDGVPDILPELERVLPTRLTSFSDRRYARLLRGRDVIISPKRLANAYEMGHSEYKITLGMAIGLPAVASPQQSYLEALAGGGGFVVDSPEEWRDALERLADPALRAEIGARAQQTVRERYSTPVVAQQYAELFRTLT